MPLLTGQIDRFMSFLTMATRSPDGFSEDAPVFEPRKLQQPSGVREVQASVAKTHFSQLLDEVERGGTIVILRHGRPIARIIPDPEGRRQRTKQAMENIRRLAKERREQFGPVTVDEILAWRHEGHKY
ncbi:MAG TPA: type II toxin-antitoxin system prevent-host-death family antitoxin [Stellaceae bacterium]|nr:type II toxin-antitoxin system prevent-host-death family antitoxin [Stellaceae bacterium]